MVWGRLHQVSGGVGTLDVTKSGEEFSVYLTGFEPGQDYRCTMVLKDTSFNYGYKTGACHWLKN